LEGEDLVSEATGRRSKEPNEDWQCCSACSFWWPVDAEFVEVGTDVPTECPRCGHCSPFAPEVHAPAIEATVRG